MLYLKERHRKYIIDKRTNHAMQYVFVRLFFLLILAMKFYRLILTTTNNC